MAQPRENPINRRQFLGSSARNAANVAAGVVGLAGVAAASTGDRVRVGVIGVRSQGRQLATTLAGLPEAEVVALCDVDDEVLGSAARAVEAIRGAGSSLRLEKDFRRLLDDPALDAVVLATPNHWHAQMTVMACQAGKDVYVEAPLTHTLEEGRAVQAWADRTGRVVSVALPQRSAPHFQSAVELVQSGAIGAVHEARAWTVHQRKPIGNRADARVPDGVDYNLWLGPAPARAFNPNRFHFHWQWFWDYGSGELGHWGVQLLDVARWGLGVSLPRHVAASGGKLAFRDDQETPDTLHVTYAFAGKTISWEHRLWSPHGPEGRNAAVAFYGDQGTLIVDRGGWKVYGQKETQTAPASDLLVPHLRDFLTCVRTRQAPTADVITGRLSSALCHLGNISQRLGRSLDFDPLHEVFLNDRAAQSMASREARAPWTLPEI